MLFFSHSTFILQKLTNLTILGHYVIVPKKVPEFIVPDLTDFEVSFPFQPSYEVYSRLRRCLGGLKQNYAILIEKWR